MSERLMIPVRLENGEHRFHDPSIDRLPDWLDGLATSLNGKDETSDLYVQEISGPRNWAKVLRELLAQAEPHPRPSS